MANAIALRDDAIVLRDKDRLQRAAFAVEAGLEEVLKAYLCLSRDPKTDEEWAVFWQAFRDHKRKLGLLKELEPDTPPERLDQLNRELRRLRDPEAPEDEAPTRSG